MKLEVPEELLAIVRAGVAAQREVPGSVALGGTVCSLFAHHRLSSDIDFVLSDLSQRFESIREKLLELPGWKEARVNAPVLILGSLGDIEIGYRQLRRTAPIQTLEIETEYGPLVIPTLEELLLTKAYLAYDRNYTRDYFDLAELTCLRSTEEVAEVLATIDEKFQWERKERIIVEVIKKLLAPDPHDLSDRKHGFEQLRFLDPKLKTWNEVVGRLNEIGIILSARVLGQ